MSTLNLSTLALYTTLVFMALSVANVSFGQTSDDSSSTIVGIEREMETGRHERLLERISTTDAPIDSFSTDGCSGGMSLAWEQMSERFPEFTERYGNQPPWEECCIAHDHLYHAGGSKAVSASESFEQRRESDLQLHSCVVKTGAERSATLKDTHELSDQQLEFVYQAIADLMFRAVRVGGMPCSKQPWRWGYGWPHCD